MDKRNVLWEKHRIMLPEMREKAVYRCQHCLFWVPIQGRKETRYGCVADVKAYGNLEKRVPVVAPVLDIIKRVGLEGLERCLEKDDPRRQSCGKFRLKS